MDNSDWLPIYSAVSPSPRTCGATRRVLGLLDFWETTLLTLYSLAGLDDYIEIYLTQPYGYQYHVWAVVLSLHVVTSVRTVQHVRTALDARHALLIIRVTTT